MNTEYPERDPGAIRCNSLAQNNSEIEKGRKINPILPAHSADPWMIFHEGNYLYCESRLQRNIHVRKATTIQEIANDPGTCVWTAPEKGPCRHGVWAPELHL